jgi:hypothetical protein
MRKLRTYGSVRGAGTIAMTQSKARGLSYSTVIRGGIF